MEDILKKIRQELAGLKPKGRTFILGIEGRGGSGKSTLASVLAASGSTFSVARMDWFPCSSLEFPLDPSGTQTRVNTKAIIERLLLPLREGRTATFSERSWWQPDCCGASHTFYPGGTLILEGCYSLHRDLREYIDFGIFIECPRKLALARAISRDGEGSRLHWEKVYVPNEDRYLSRHRPFEYADMILKTEELL